MVVWLIILAAISSAAMRMFGNSISFELNNYGPQKRRKIKTWYNLGLASALFLGASLVLIFIN